MSTSTEIPVHNPVEDLLRKDRIPTIWCPGCGIGCSGRVGGYMATDHFHTTHGRAIPMATGIALTRPDLNVIVYSGDGDLVSIGGNHLIHAARRNVNLLVICVNNMIYAMTGGQAAATTPGHSTTATTPFGSFEPDINIPQLVDAAGAVYVARWTAFHVKQLETAVAEALKKKGFRFIEVVTPCPTLYQRRNNMGDGLAAMKDYKERSKIRNGAPTHEVAIVPGQQIVCGKFVDRERPDYLTLMRASLGEHYQEWHDAPEQVEEGHEGGCGEC